MTSVRYSLGLSLFIGLLLVCFGQELYTLWLGHKLNNEDIMTVYWVTVVMSVAFIFGAPQLVSVLMLKGTGKHWYTTKVSLATAVIAIALSVVLMKYTSLGVFSAAIAWGLRYSISQAILYPINICRDYKIGTLEYFRKSYSIPLLTSVPIVFFLSLASKYVSSVSILNAVIVLFLYALLCAALFFFFILLPKHRKLFCEKLSVFGRG